VVLSPSRLGQLGGEPGVPAPVRRRRAPASYERFDITRRADAEPTVLLLLIGVAVTELAVWGRRQHVAAGRRAGYLGGIYATAEAVAAGGSPSAVITELSDRLVRLLSLRSCHFQHGVAGLGNPPRLQRDGHVVAGHRAWDVEAEGLPRDRETKLLVESGGILQGRFLLTPDTRPTLEQRLVAVALVDQVGAALAESHPVPE